MWQNLGDLETGRAEELRMTHSPLIYVPSGLGTSMGQHQVTAIILIYSSRTGLRVSYFNYQVGSLYSLLGPRSAGLRRHYRPIVRHLMHLHRSVI